MSPGPAHELMVAETVSAIGAERCGFRRSLNALAIENMTPDLELARFIPDAFKVYRDRGEIVAFEVEVTHEVDVEKFRDYIANWWEIDCMGYELRLVLVDRRRCWVEIDLCHAWYEMHTAEGVRPDRLKPVGAYVALAGTDIRTWAPT